MIDWAWVAFTVLWVVGLAFVLATFSFANYLAYHERQRFRQVIARPTLEFVMNLGLALFCLGLVGNAEALWERVLWGILASMFVVQAGWARARK